LDEGIFNSGFYGGKKALDPTNKINPTDKSYSEIEMTLHYL
jgi:hypothetical protein